MSSKRSRGPLRWETHGSMTRAPINFKRTTEFQSLVLKCSWRFVFRSLNQILLALETLFPRAGCRIVTQIIPCLDTLRVMTLKSLKLTIINIQIYEVPLLKRKQL